ncbi:MAG: tryptophanase [Alistipes sp.]|nr:tryptophanase [Alistipes sp.]
MKLPYAEPYRMKTVETIHTSTRAEREKWIADAKYNLFNLESRQVYIDLLTDSGTGAMSDRQWAAMMTGDESYAGASSFYRLKEQVRRIFGFEYFLPTHQGRAAENVLFSALVKEGDIIPGNSHFDTTKGHIEYRRAMAVDCTVREAFDTRAELPFKGNVDCGALEDVLRSHPREKIPFICLTITNNTSGGQPVSMENIKNVAALSKKYGVPLLIDSARFAENAYFIKIREDGYSTKSVKEIVAEIYSYADMMTMSAKKDGVVNIGGFAAMKDRELFRRVSVFNIMFEGFLTYGGMSGRDMDALAVGLDENTEFEQLNARISQVGYLGKKLDGYGIPYQRPAGGHAIFVDAKKFLVHVPKEQFIAQTLGIELYLEGGVRAVEIGALLADRDPVTRQNRYPELELLRLAIPRRSYTDNHMDYIAAALKNIYDRRESITTGYRITYEAPIMRHFTVELTPVAKR